MKKKKGSKNILGKINNKMLLIGGIGVLSIVLPLLVLVTQQQQNMTQHAAGPAVSPLIFGTNLHLDNPSDPFITSQGFRNGLQSAKVQFVRLPIRTIGAPDATAITAAQNIKAMGAVPLIIFKYSQPDPVGADIQVVQAMNGIFGSQRVYYELGNERDLAGINAQSYTTEWNQVAPAVKQAAPNAWIGGPVNFQANPQYIAYFVKNATTPPDFISWHWYTCPSTATNQTCIGNIAHFPTHVSDTRQAIQANGNAVPPIMITEWNYAPDAGVPNDTKHNDPVFLTQWTTQALQQLADPINNIFASNIYDVTNVLPLSDNNGNLTTQGQVFQHLFSTLLNGNTAGISAAPTVVLLPTNTVMPQATSTLAPLPTDTPIPTVALPTTAPTGIIIPQPTSIQTTG